MNKNIGYILLTLILIATLLPVGEARTTEKFGVFVDYDTATKTTTISNFLGGIVQTQLIEYTPVCVDCKSLTKVVFLKDVSDDYNGWKTNFNVVKGRMNNYKETIYYLEDEKYIEIENKMGTCSRDLNLFDKQSGKNETTKIEYECVVGIENVEKTRQVKVYPDISKEGWKAGVEYYILREATLQTGSVIDYIPVSHGVEITEEAWWNFDFATKRKVTFNTTSSSLIKLPFLLNSSVGVNGQEIWVIPQEAFNTTTNYTEYFYYNNWTDGSQLVNTSENERLPINADSTANATERNYLAYNLWQSNYMPGVWHFNGTTSASMTAPITWVGTSYYNKTGKFGYGRTFNGVAGNRATIAHNTLFEAENFSACIWANQLGPQAGDIGFLAVKTTYSQTDSWGITNNQATGTWGMEVNWEWANAPNQNYPAGTWVWVCGTYTTLGNNLTTYLNGTALKSVAVSGKINAGTDAIKIGGRNEAAFYMFNGTLDEFVYFNRTLTAEEIRTLYQSYTREYNLLGIEETPNFSPRIENITITPNPAYTTSTLNCSATYSDVDGDKGNVSITWYNGSSLFWQIIQLNKINGEQVNEPLTWIDTNGLVGYWKFSEGNGTQTRDISGNENNGTLLNKTIATCFVNGACPDWVVGKAGRGLSFDGKGDFIDVGKDVSFNISNEITVSAWVYLNSFDRFNKITGKTNSYVLGVNVTGNFTVNNKGYAYFQIFNSTNMSNANVSWIAASSQVLSPNVWYYLTGIYNGSEIRICVNTICNITYVTGSINNMTNSSVQIGKTATPTCPQNMSYINKLGGYCIDKYEATCAAGGGTGCAATSAIPLSQNNSNPWMTVNWSDAKRACLRAGKYLCSDPEWLAAAVGTPDTLTSAPARTDAGTGEGPEPCHIWNTGSGDAIPEHPDHSIMQDTAYNWGSNKGFIKTGSAVNCTSDAGVYDMIGNFWEWTDRIDNYLAVPSQADGYVGTIIGDTAGNYNNDYYYTAYDKDANHKCYITVYGQSEDCAAFRSGDWYTGDLAGRFALFLGGGPATSLVNVGFRCCSVPLS
jgi:formylglycine-generating enzyme required for sulfatase activity